MYFYSVNQFHADYFLCVCVCRGGSAQLLKEAKVEPWEVQKNGPANALTVAFLSPFISPIPRFGAGEERPATQHLCLLLTRATR